MYLRKVKMWMAGVFLPRLSFRIYGSLMFVMMRMYGLEVGGWGFCEVGCGLWGNFYYDSESSLYLYERFLSNFYAYIFNVYKSHSIYRVFNKLGSLDGNIFFYQYFYSLYQKKSLLLP